VLGILIGLPLTLAVARLLNTLLYGVKPYDSVSIAVATVGIVTVTAMGCLIPAQRAASIHQIEFEIGSVRIAVLFW
jgi:ABC-type antimicrobial peptide transport system permease subunit